MKSKFPNARFVLLVFTILAGWICSLGSACAQTYSKTESIAYHDNTALWVMGQTSSITCVGSVPASTACDGDVETATSYDATYALAVTKSAFGALQYATSYDTSSSVSSGQRGTVKTVTDGNGNVTTLTSWKRGIPQSIAFPSSPTLAATYKSADVDDNGWVRSVTDQLLNKTCYAYDDAGRLSAITYPSESVVGNCDSTSWAKLNRSFDRVSGVEFGVAFASRATEWTGNGYSITYYDAMWRPLLVRSYDAANVAGTDRFVKTIYNARGQVEFKSYPSTSSVPSTGTWTTYDALGRITSVSDDSELGLLTTSTSYGAPFTTTVTNPRGFSTTTSYQVFDTPSTEAPVLIQAPEGQTTTIVRDPFGKPLSITQSGPEI